MAFLLRQPDSSQEAETGKLSRSNSENDSEHNPNWDSPTPTVHDYTAAVNDAEAVQPVVDEKPPKADPNLVTWSGPDDPANPHNWSTRRKLAITGIWVYGNVVTTIASSIFSSGAELIEQEFHVSTTVAILGVSLFVLVSKRSVAVLFCPLDFSHSPSTRKVLLT